MNPPSSLTRRWNGWGDLRVNYPLPPSAADYLVKRIGQGTPSPDIRFEQARANIPASKLENRRLRHPLISLSPDERLLHARGQSLPDWVALRSGQIDCFPDGVAYPSSDQEVRQLLAFAKTAELCVIPYGGGTSVVGHINPTQSDRPVLTIDLSHMNQLLSLDEVNFLATFQAGINGPQLEKVLNQAGYTLGHFPQSFELSTLGGWIAARSTGQQSYYFGRIEDLFAGGNVETPIGAIRLPTLPASAAGPDLRHVILGSEGRLGVVASATLRVRKLPASETFSGVFFHDWQSGVNALREIVQEKSCVSMLRLSDADETDTTLMLSGKDSLVTWAVRGLNTFGYDAARSLLIFGVTGDDKGTRAARQRVHSIARAHGGLPCGELIGKMWQKSRFLTPYLRNTLWEFGYALDTLETALKWSEIPATTDEIKQVIRNGLEPFGENVLVFAHLSHIYRDGASLYVTFLFRRSPDPQITLQRWQRLKTAASQVIVKAGGTISHQHGVGIDHADYLPAEKGPLGMRLLESLASTLDPQNMMNPGKLFRRHNESIPSNDLSGA